jgi:predicted nucleic acid-binding protein
MKISSDTSIWIDLQTICALEIPFRLQHEFYMSEPAIQDELLTPPDITKKLIDLGLRSLSITSNELTMTDHFMAEHIKLSRYDAIALSISKERGYTLLTSDKAMRSAAISNGVRVVGLLWIFDELKNNRILSVNEYHGYMKMIELNNGKKIRLPADEISSRL